MKNYHTWYAVDTELSSLLPNDTKILNDLQILETFKFEVQPLRSSYFIYRLKDAVFLVAINTPLM